MHRIYKNEVVEIYDLSIIKCSKILLKTNLERNGHYYLYYKRLLHRKQALRIYEAGLPQIYFNDTYCSETLKLSDEKINNINFGEIDAINDQFGDIKGTHVNFDNTVVSFNDSYILEPIKDESEYYQYLCLMLCTVSFPEIKEVLKYHIRKHDNLKYFETQLLDFFMELPNLIGKTEIKDRIIKWFEENDNPSKTYIISNSKSNPTSFKEIFSNEGWEKYIEAMQKTDPILINENFEFVGNPKGHKGVISSWIGFLKSKGIIKQNINRYQLTKVLNQEIKNLDLGSGGKTIDNFSKRYKYFFENQLIKLSS